MPFSVLSLFCPRWIVVLSNGLGIIHTAYAPSDTKFYFCFHPFLVIPSRHRDPPVPPCSSTSWRHGAAQILSPHWHQYGRSSSNPHPLPTPFVFFLTSPAPSNSVLPL